MISIIKKDQCCGCSACFNMCTQNCIVMEIDNEGFYYPNVDSSICIYCRLCEKVCPILHKEQVRNKPQAYACKNKDENIRRQSSSGGVFSILAQMALAKGGVVYGAVFNREKCVVHVPAQTITELAAMRGSKYVQSSIGTVFKQIKTMLETDRPVVFVGTPCQAAGLKSFLRQESHNLLIVDFICHGVPSPAVFREYIRQMEKASQADITDIQFRDKRAGWKSFCVTSIYANKREISKLFYDDPYMRGFLNNLYLRPSCYNCQFKYPNTFSDITIGDYWGIDNVHPSYDDDLGVSLVMVHTKKGQAVFEKAREKMSVMESSFELAVTHNSSVMRSVMPHKRRDLFFKSFQLKPLSELIEDCLRPRLLERLYPESLVRKLKKKTLKIIKMARR